MGLDRDDPVVRRRVGQKMEFITDGAHPPPRPSGAAGLAGPPPGPVQTQARYTLQQIHFDPARRGNVAAAAQRALAVGKRGSGRLDDAARRTRRTHLGSAAAFGADFDALQTLPTGAGRGRFDPASACTWSIDGAHDARAATLRSRPEVERDLFGRAPSAQEAYFQDLRAKYAVRVEAGARGMMISLLRRGWLSPVPCWRARGRRCVSPGLPRAAREPAAIATT